MPQENVSLLAFNRGLLSRLGLARHDLKRHALSAAEQTNWLPRTLGSMMLRPGLQYLDSTKSNAQAVHIPFIFAADDTAILELTNTVLRVRVNESIITRPSVSTVVTSGDFSSATGWTDADEAGATSTISGGILNLIGTGINAAIRTQQVTVAGGDQNVEHALNVLVATGLVTLRVGSSSGADDYITQTELGVGMHSLAFTPTGNFHIHLSSRTPYASVVDAITVASSGAMEITTPWLTADLPSLRWDTSGDVVFVACDGYQQRRIERRATRSWSVVLYNPSDGPFLPINTSSVRLTPSAISGDITLTASAALFRSTHVGALFRLSSIGQQVSVAASGADQFSDPIRVTGIGSARSFTYTASGTYSGSWHVQSSVGEPGSWADTSASGSANTSATFSDGLDNQIVYYRIGVKTGNYVSGTFNLSLTYASGSIDGVARITGYSSSTSATAAVLESLGGTAATADWSEGSWSDYRGWPTAVALHEGRLWWAGRDTIWGSVSDAFDSFDDATEGDSGPIARSIGSGPVDRINWLLPLQRLMIGGEMAERSARASSLDEPLTPTGFVLRDASTQGSTDAPPAKVDRAGLYISGTRLFLLSNDNDPYADYGSVDLTQFCPEVGEGGFTRIAVQRNPDTRIHAVRADGGVGVLIFDPLEEVRCWVEVETDGFVEDVFVLPGAATSDEDKVYYLVNRTINGSTKRYLERWALESECVGGTLNKQADSFLTYTGSAVTTITGLSHLEGETVVVWGNGKDLGTKVVASGQITGLSEAVTNAVVGLSYEARFQSTKLAYAAGKGAPLTQRKRVDHVGLILADTHYQGLRYGPDFDHLDELPLWEDGTATTAHTVHENYDADAIEFSGTWDTDSRICLVAEAPRPCTVLAAVVSITTHDKP